LSGYFSGINEAEFLATKILYETAFSPDECNKIIEISKTLPEIEAYLRYGNVDSSKRKTKLKYIEPSPQSAWIDQRIMMLAEQANQKFYNYKLHSMAELQVLEYDPGSHFDWHMDTGAQKPFSDRKISVTVFLSDPDEYEGGKLEWMPAIKNFSQEKGIIALFPSYKLHRVSTVTKGTRYSLVAWIYGE
jgi:PKHD-type hydroxylase